MSLVLLWRSGRSVRLMKDVDLSILKLVAENTLPIGQGSLSYRLKRQGVSISAPTVGRRLYALEAEGLLRKVGVDGRIITNRGLRLL